jgi:Short C-terminal domain
MPKAKGPDLGYHRWFAGTRYLGGHSKFSEGWGGVLFFTTEAIGLGKTALTGPLECVIPMDTVTSIEITSQQVAKSRLGAMFLAGVLALGAKDSAHTTTIVVRTNDDEIAYFLIQDSVPDAVKAVLTPFIRALNIPFYEEPATSTAPLPAPPAPDLADQIRKLAALRDDGLITDAEYETQKARLLNPGP